MRWRSERFFALALALGLASVLGGCAEDDSDKARAAREYLRVELDGKNCCRLSEQQSLEHLERAVALDPGSATVSSARAPVSWSASAGSTMRCSSSIGRSRSRTRATAGRSAAGCAATCASSTRRSKISTGRSRADPRDRTVSRRPCAGARRLRADRGRPRPTPSFWSATHSWDRDSHFVARRRSSSRRTGSLTPSPPSSARSPSTRTRRISTCCVRVSRTASATGSARSPIERPPSCAAARRRCGLAWTPSPIVPVPPLATSKLAAVPVELTPEVAGEGVRWPPSFCSSNRRRATAARSTSDTATSPAARPASAPDRVDAGRRERHARRRARHRAPILSSAPAATAAAWSATRSPSTRTSAALWRFPALASTDPDGERPSDLAGVAHRAASASSPTPPPGPTPNRSAPSRPVIRSASRGAATRC